MEPLTFAKIQEAVKKATLAGLREDPYVYVHPLRYLFAVRGIDPILSWPLPEYVNELAEQTEADYFGWGINGCES